MEGQAITAGQLAAMQKWETLYKIQVSKSKLLSLCQIVGWDVAVSFSGGKDSAVLLDMAAGLWALFAADHGGRPLTVVFANTGNEHAGMPTFVKNTCAWMERKHGIAIDLHTPRGEKGYWEVVRDEGYPIASKLVARQVRDIRKWVKGHGISWDSIKDRLDQGVESADLLRGLGASHTVVSYLTGIRQDNGNGTCKLAKRWRPLVPAPFETSEVCCNILKKAPMRMIEKGLGLAPVTGEMASDGGSRYGSYLKTGCFNRLAPGVAKVMGFWMEQDVLWYHARYQIPHFEAYGDLECGERGYRFTGEQRTGCKLCLFGIMYDWGRLARLGRREPQTLEWALRPAKDGGLGYGDVIDYLNKHCRCRIEV